MQHAMQNGGAMRNAMQGDAGALQHKIQHNTTYNTGGRGPSPPYNATRYNTTYNKRAWGPFHHTIQFSTTYNAGGWGPPPSDNTT